MPDKIEVGPISRVHIHSFAAGVILPIEVAGGLVLAQPFTSLLETGIVVLIEINDRVDQNEYSDSIAVPLGGTYSGEILAVTLMTTEDGTGAILRPNGKLIFLDSDPVVSAGDAALGAANWSTIIPGGIVDVLTTDWTIVDTTGAAAAYPLAIPFHPLSTLYFVWHHEAATSFNDAAGDDERLRCNIEIRRDS